MKEASACSKVMQSAGYYFEPKILVTHGVALLCSAKSRKMPRGSHSCNQTFDPCKLYCQVQSLLPESADLGDKFPPEGCSPGGFEKEQSDAFQEKWI